MFKVILEASPNDELIGLACLSHHLNPDEYRIPLLEEVSCVDGAFNFGSVFPLSAWWREVRSTFSKRCFRSLPNRLRLRWMRAQENRQSEDSMRANMAFALHDLPSSSLS